MNEDGAERALRREAMNLLTDYHIAVARALRQPTVENKERAWALVADIEALLVDGIRYRRTVR